MKVLGRRLEKYLEDVKLRICFLIMVDNWKAMDFYFWPPPFQPLPTHKKYNRMSFYRMGMWIEVFKHRSNCLQVFCKIAVPNLSFFYKIALLKFSFSKICRKTPKLESLFKSANPATLIKMRLRHRYVSVYLAKISKHFFQRTLPVYCFCKCMTAEELETQ